MMKVYYFFKINKIKLGNNIEDKCTNININSEENFQNDTNLMEGFVFRILIF